MIRFNSTMHFGRRSKKFLPVLVALAAGYGMFADNARVAAEEAPKETKPWAEGVSETDQAAAIKLFQDGNKEFGQRSYAAALRLYKEAIGRWDHPAIRFNMSECQIHLDEPALAFENLKRALKYDAAPLEPAIYERALTNKKLLEGQLAYLVVENKEKGAEVTLDGESLLSGPGSVRQVIKPGRHQLVAKKDGRLTQTEELTLLPGETTTIKVRLPEIGEVPLVRRWSAWKPWAVVGGGAAVVLGGVALQLNARSNMDDYDRFIDTQCVAGCSQQMLDDGGATKKRDRAELRDAISLGMMGVGAAALTTGVVLAILNSPRRGEIGPRRVPPRREISFAPVVTPDTTGVAFSVRY